MAAVAAVAAVSAALGARPGRPELRASDTSSPRASVKAAKAVQAYRVEPARCAARRDPRLIHRCQRGRFLNDAGLAKAWPRRAASRLTCPRHAEQRGSAPLHLHGESRQNARDVHHLALDGAAARVSCASQVAAERRPRNSHTLVVICVSTTGLAVSRVSL